MSGRVQSALINTIISVAGEGSNYFEMCGLKFTVCVVEKQYHLQANGGSEFNGLRNLISLHRRMIIIGRAINWRL